MSLSLFFTFDRISLTKNTIHTIPITICTIPAAMAAMINGAM
jgi:hypothetical protein